MPPDATPVHTVKLGGSLLNWPEMPSRLAQLLTTSASQCPLLIVGGGAAADIVRSWQQAHALDDNTAHALAIDAMAMNSQLLTTLLPRTRIVTDHAQANEAWATNHWPILDCGTFLAAQEPLQALKLPHSWQATSDTIAGWIARTWPASRLTLIKSVDLPSDPSPTRVSDAGLVDGQLAAWIDQLPATEWVNLRSATPQPVRWQPQGNQPVP